MALSVSLASSGKKNWGLVGLVWKSETSTAGIRGEMCAYTQRDPSESHRRSSVCTWTATSSFRAVRLGRHTAVCSREFSCFFVLLLLSYPTERDRAVSSSLIHHFSLIARLGRKIFVEKGNKNIQKKTYQSSGGDLIDRNYQFISSVCSSVAVGVTLFRLRSFYSCVILVAGEYLFRLARYKSCRIIYCGPSITSLNYRMRKIDSLVGN